MNLSTQRWHERAVARNITGQTRRRARTAQGTRLATIFKVQVAVIPPTRTPAPGPGGHRDRGALLDLYLDGMLEGAELAGHAARGTAAVRL